MVRWPEDRRRDAEGELWGCRVMENGDPTTFCPRPVRATHLGPDDLMTRVRVSRAGLPEIKTFIDPSITVVVQCIADFCGPRVDRGVKIVAVTSPQGTYGVGTPQGHSSVAITVTVVIATLIDETVVVVIGTVTHRLCRGAVFPGVSEPDAGTVTSEQHQTLSRTVVSEGMEAACWRARGWCLLRPMGPVPLPGVREQGVAVVLASEQNHALPCTVVSEGMAPASWRTRGWGPLGPVDPVPLPGVREEARAGAVASKQYDALPCTVVSEGVTGVSRRACGRSQLRPVGPVPLPRVHEEEAVNAAPSEQNHAPSRSVVGEGMTLSSRQTCGRGPLRPVG